MFEYAYEKLDRPKILSNKNAYKKARVLDKTIALLIERSAKNPERPIEVQDVIEEHNRFLTSLDLAILF